MNTGEQINQLLEEEMKEYGYDYPCLDDVDLKLESGEIIYFSEYENDGWDNQGKYQYQEAIYQAYISETGNWENAKPIDMFFSQDIQRSGSYFSDYDYTHEKPVEVELHEYEKTITVREWVSK